ncbi:hypothetical protein, partial [Chryseomicrobium aureum]|uniref:hypothetical protein n=1 Tax=Chryseomicrobium aureum TaxID=1441723 RepID=UPI00195BC8A5
SADGSWGSPPVRVGRRWATEKKVIPSGVAFFVCKKVDIIYSRAVCSSEFIILIFMKSLFSLKRNASSTNFYLTKVEISLFVR